MASNGGRTNGRMGPDFRRPQSHAVFKRTVFGWLRWARRSRTALFPARTGTSSAPNTGKRFRRAASRTLPRERGPRSAVALDAWSRRVVGWSMATDLRTSLVLDAFGMALMQRRSDGVIHHSGRGSQPVRVLRFRQPVPEGGGDVQGRGPSIIPLEAR